MRIKVSARASGTAPNYCAADRLRCPQPAQVAGNAVVDSAKRYPGGETIAACRRQESARRDAEGVRVATNITVAAGPVVVPVAREVNS